MGEPRIGVGSSLSSETLTNVALQHRQAQWLDFGLDL